MRKALFVLLLLAFVASASAQQYYLYNGTAMDAAGTALVSPSVLVTLVPPAGVASIYTDAGTTPKANPFTAAADGTYSFYAVAGRYQVDATKSGFTYTTFASLPSGSSTVNLTSLQGVCVAPSGTLTVVWDTSGNASCAVGGGGGGMVYPGAGVANSTGAAWGTSYTVGTGANNLVQLNGSSQLPAVSAALLTAFPTLNQNTTGTAADLSATLSVAHGGTGTSSTLTGLVRGSASAMTAAELSGDCTTSGSNAITCTKTSGTTFATSATTDTTNGSNIASGTVALARLPTDWPLATQTVTGGGTASRCARFDASHHLVEYSADCSSGGGANPAGSGTELQYRVNGTTFGAVTGTSVSGGDISSGGIIQTSGSFRSADGFLYFTSAGTPIVEAARGTPITSGISHAGFKVGLTTDIEFSSTASAENAPDVSISDIGNGGSLGVLAVSHTSVVGSGGVLATWYATLKGANVASAATITPTAGLFHVTGTTQITTINLPFTGFTGCINVIPDGAFTTATGGNIALASTAVVSKVLIECYDGTSWYPSY